ncbi:MAG: hypothetical protein QM820_49805 [Minicystis sp.]
MRAPTIWGLVSTAFAAVSIAGCGVTVLVPGETVGAGGQGAGGQGVGGLGAGGLGAGGLGGEGGSQLPEGCMAACSIPSNGIDTCACVLTCGGFPGNGKAECAPSVDLQGNLKIKCACTVNAEFTGICFEKNPAHLCDFELGCCGKYLGK